MSLLRRYCNDNYSISYSEFDKLPLDERESLSKTWGYFCYISGLSIEKAWDKLIKSI
jgi:hypothetical protein